MLSCPASWLGRFVGASSGRRMAWDGRGGVPRPLPATERIRTPWRRSSPIPRGGADLPSHRSGLYQIYSDWCESTGEYCQKQRWLSSAILRRKGVAAYRTEDERGFSGIGERIK